MINKIKNILLTLTVASALVVPAIIPAMVHATSHDAINKGLCDGVIAATGGSACTETTEGAGSVNSIIRAVINFFSLIIGAVAVIMIIYGGFKYITSGGNDGNVSGAKNTILYAIIGLIIVALAQVIVRFVLTRATTPV